MKSRFLADTLYSAVLTQIVPTISSTGNETDVFEIFVDTPPRYTSGWVILDFENKLKRDLIFFHNRVGNVLYYYRKDRDLLGIGAINSQHSVQASVRMNDNAGWINHALSNVDDFGQISRWGITNKVMVFGGKVSVNEVTVTVSDTIITVPSGTKEIVFDYSDNTIKQIDTSSLGSLNGQWLGTVISSGSAITSVIDLRASLSPLKVNTSFFTYVNGKLSIATGGITTAQILDGSITISKMAANSVGTTQLVDQSVTYEKIGLDAIGILNMKPNSVGTNQIVAGSVNRSKIESDAIDSTKLADDAVGSEHIQAGAVGTSEIGTGSVTAEKLGSGSVEKAKIAPLAVDGSKIESNSITQDKMADNSVGTAEIIDANITKQKMASNSVGTAQLENNSVVPDKIPDGSIPQSKLGIDSVGQSQIQANAVGSDEIAPSAVGTSEIANSSVTLEKMAANSVGTSQIQNSNVTTDKIANEAVTEPKIGTGSISSRTIGSQQVQSSHIGLGEVTSANIQNRTITGGDIGLNTILSENIAPGSIMSDRLSSEITGLSLKTGLDASDVAGAGYLLQKIKQGSGAVIQEVLDAGIRKLEISFNTGSLYTYTGSEGVNVSGTDMRLGKSLGAGGTSGQISTDREIISNDKILLYSGQGARIASGLTASDTIHSSIQGLSIASAVHEISSNITLGIQHSNVIVAANNLIITLPQASLCKGRSYTISRKSLSYALLNIRTTDGALLFAFGGQNSNVTVSGSDRTYVCDSYPYSFTITSIGNDWIVSNTAIDDDDISATIALKENSSNKSNSVSDIASTTKFPVWAIINSWATGLFATIASVALKANDSAVLHNTGNETSTGLKKFENIGVQTQTAGDNNLRLDLADSANWRSKIRLYFVRSRGTLGSRTNTLVGDVLGAISFAGWLSGSEKGNGEVVVTDNGTRGKASVAGMDVEFDGVTKVVSLVLGWNVNADLTENYGPNLRIGGNGGEFAFRIRKQDLTELASFTGSGDVYFTGAQVKFNNDGREMTLNEQRKGRNSVLRLKTKNNTNDGGMDWVHYADADGSIVGNKRYAIWGYPRDNSGNTAGFNQYFTIEHPENGSNFNDYNFRNITLDSGKISYGNGITGYRRSGTSPEGSLTANPGSTAQMTNGTMWLKVSGTGSTGWQSMEIPVPVYGDNAIAGQKASFSTTSSNSSTIACSIVSGATGGYTWSFTLNGVTAIAYAGIFKNGTQVGTRYSIGAGQSTNLTGNIDLAKNDTLQIRVNSNYEGQTVSCTNMKLMYGVSFSSFNATVS